MTDSQTLLAEYSKSGSDGAFRELVARYLDFVYSTAVRVAGCDCHLAEDVTQTVFIHLAQKAHRLPKDIMLGGWLHRNTCNVATPTPQNAFQSFMATVKTGDPNQIESAIHWDLKWKDEISDEDRRMMDKSKQDYLAMLLRAPASLPHSAWHPSRRATAIGPGCSSTF